MLDGPYLRNVNDVAFDNLEKRVLDPLAGNVAADAHVSTALSDFVGFVNVHDAPLAPLNVLAAFEVQLEQHALHVFANVPGLRQARRVGNHKRNVNHPSERLDEERFARPRWPCDK